MLFSWRKKFKKKIKKNITYITGTLHGQCKRYRWGKGRSEEERRTGHFAKGKLAAQTERDQPRFSLAIRFPQITQLHQIVCDIQCETSLKHSIFVCYILHVPRKYTNVPHPAVDLKSKETVSCWAILVGCIKSSAHPVADLKLRGTSWLLEIMAEWADISAQAAVLSRPPQRELLPLLHHLGHQGTVLSKSGHNNVSFFLIQR